MKNPTPPNTVNTLREMGNDLQESIAKDIAGVVEELAAAKDTIKELQYLNKTLQETNVSLQELSVKMEEELKAIKWNNDGLFAVAEELKSQLATAKEENAKLREALQKVQDWARQHRYNPVIPWDREIAPLLEAVLSASEKEK